MNEILKQEIVSILISEEEDVKIGSNGDYVRDMAVISERYQYAADKIISLIQAITDPENQPNQYGIILTTHP